MQCYYSKTEMKGAVKRVIKGHYSSTSVNQEKK